MAVGVPGEGSCCAGLSSKVRGAYRVSSTLGWMVTENRMRNPGDGFWGAMADLPQRS